MARIPRGVTDAGNRLGVVHDNDGVLLALDPACPEPEMSAEPGAGRDLM